MSAIKLIPMLNCGAGRPGQWLALGIALSIGLIYARLTVIHARPAARPVVPTMTTPREDADLFVQALAAGLLRQNADGRITVAPADLPLRHIYQRDHSEWLTPRHAEPDWLAGPWNDAVRRLHRALHFSPAGRYVRQRIALFNTRRNEAVSAGPLQWGRSGMIEGGHEE